MAFLEGNVFLMCLFIFLARISDVTFMSIRTILITKGIVKVACLCSFFEVMIYIVVLSQIVNKLDNPYYLISYCLGFAAGNYIGAKIEGKLAFGDAQVRVVLSEQFNEIATELRDNGFGVTVFKGEGRDGERAMLMINLKRKRIPEVYSYFREKNIKAFISTNDITSYEGGYDAPTQAVNFIRKFKK